MTLPCVVLCWHLLLISCYYFVCSSEETGVAAPAAKYHDIQLAFPRDGELLLRDHNSVIDLCFYFYARVNFDLSNFVLGPVNYTLFANIGDISVTHEFFIELNTSQVPMQRKCWKIYDNHKITTAEIRAKFVERVSETSIAEIVRYVLFGEESDIETPMVITDSNLPIPHNGQSHPKIDYLEIGTSNFNTCLMMKVAMCDPFYSDYYCNENHTVSGISVDIVSSYLKFIPKLDYTRKYRLAISGNANRSQTILPMYSIPPSVMKLIPNMPWWMNGCLKVDSIHEGIAIELIKKSLNPAVIQKDWVQVMGISTFMETFVNAPIRLVKIDVEGMDGEIIDGLIDYYESSLGKNIDSRWACMLYFEEKLLMPEENTLLIEKIQRVGYIPFRQDIDADDNAFVNCKCSAYDFQTISMYLIFDYGVQLKFASIISQCQIQE